MDHRRRLRWRISFFGERRPRAAGRDGEQSNHLRRNLFQDDLPRPAHWLHDFAAQHGCEPVAGYVSHRPVRIRDPAGGPR